MKIAVIGGTGKEGYGLSMRWALAGHEVIIGSRDDERGKKAAEEIKEKIKTGLLDGTDNKSAAISSDIVLLSIPYSGIDLILADIKEELENKIVISIIAPIEKDPEKNYFKYKEIDENSAAEKVQAILPKSKVVSALHNISFKSLRELETNLEADVLVCGNFDDAKEVCMKLIEDIKDLRAIDVGILENSKMIESITPLLMNINFKHKKKGVEIKLSGF